MLSVKNLSAEVDGKRILSGVDFEVKENETVVFLGENGAGKSTMMKAIVGAPGVKVISETVDFAQKPDKWEILKMTPDERARAGIMMCFQDPEVIEGVKTTELVREALMARGERLSRDEVIEREAEASKKLKTSIFMTEREVNKGFSGGEKKKNEILQMLVLRPKLVILDEIDSGLDVDAAGQISKILMDYQRETGCSFLVITHNMKILKHLQPTRCYVLHQGKIVAEGDGKMVKRVEKEGYGWIK